jgi:two-component system, NarL family, response regulator LiaR
MSSSERIIRIVLADHHPGVREGLHAVLETQPHLQVIAEATNKDEVLKYVSLLQPDLVLLDLDMLMYEYVHVIRLIRQQAACIRIIVFSIYSDVDQRSLIKQGEVDGHLLKGVPRKDLFDMIQHIMYE